MKQFRNPQHCLDYLLAEIVDTLRDDLEQMESKGDSDRQIMRDTIAEIEAITPDIILFSHDERVTLSGALALAATMWESDIKDGASSEAEETLWRSHVTDIEALDERLSP